MRAWQHVLGAGVGSSQHVNPAGWCLLTVAEVAPRTNHILCPLPCPGEGLSSVLVETFACSSFAVPASCQRGRSGDFYSPWLPREVCLSPTCQIANCTILRGKFDRNQHFPPFLPLHPDSYINHLSNKLVGGWPSNLP